MVLPHHSFVSEMSKQTTNHTVSMLLRLHEANDVTTTGLKTAATKTLAQ